MENLSLKIPLLAFIILYTSSPAAGRVGEFSFASYYGDHMVLQKAPQKAVLWGYTNIIHDTVKVIVGEDGYVTVAYRGPQMAPVWRVVLKPMDQIGPFNITAINSIGQRIQLEDVLFGDVWLCSGQSNMEMTVPMIFNASEELADAHNYPHIRLFTVADVQSGIALYDLKNITEPWSLPSEASLNGTGEFTYFSALCWLYGKYLHQILNYPIGLVASSWSGTSVEVWSSPDALAQCGIRFNNSDFPSKFVPSKGSVLWNAMVHPLLNMTVYGVIWYQGEANTILNCDLYNCTFPAMINDWRKKFSAGPDKQTSPDFPFGFVQLAGFRKNPEITTGFPDIRWHQTADFGYVPNLIMKNVFMAVAMDLPDFTSPYSMIHPRDKQDIAKRLVLSGLAIAYNRKIVFQGPIISAVMQFSQSSELCLYFKSSTGPIKVLNKNGFEVRCKPKDDKYGTNTCTGSYFADRDTSWFKTPIESFSGFTVTVSYKVCGTNHVAGIRYAWRETPCDFKECPIYGLKSDLPAPPFIKTW